MTSAQWQAVRTLFGGALNQPPERRTTFVDFGTDDPLVRLKVLEFLDIGINSTDWLDRFIPHDLLDEAMAKALIDPPVSERRIGPYRLLREIGSGTTGTVHLAEHVETQHHVAVRVLDFPQTSPERIERFLLDRRVLIQMAHPHIARVYEAGMTETDDLYFAVERVEGEPITTYCTRTGLDEHDRLALFVTVGEAVQYAHSNLIVHHNLNPDNILVTSDGGVKLVDFGVAPLLSDDDETTALTTRPDIHQLGLLLRELLPELSPESDLNAIMETALHEEPEQRHQTAEALVTDVQRALQAPRPISWFRWDLILATMIALLLGLVLGLAL